MKGVEGTYRTVYAGSDRNLSGARIVRATVAGCKQLCGGSAKCCGALQHRRRVQEQGRKGGLRVCALHGCRHEAVGQRQSCVAGCHHLWL